MLVLADAGGVAGTIVGFAIAVAFAVICNRIAVRKGRGPILWAVLGFFFPLVAFIVILLLPRKAPRY